MNVLLWLRYAFKNLRSGLKGFYILLTCLTLGVAAIAVIGSLTSAIEQGLTEQYFIPRPNQPYRHFARHGHGQWAIHIGRNQSG
jgi:hypothetical protein